MTIGEVIDRCGTERLGTVGWETHKAESKQRLMPASETSLTRNNEVHLVTPIPPTPERRGDSNSGASRGTRS